MTISAVNKMNIHNQLKNQSQISLTPSTSAWMKAIADSLSVSKIQPSTFVSDKAYSLNISDKGLKEMQMYQDQEIAIANTEVLSYNKNLTMNYKDY